MSDDRWGSLRSIVDEARALQDEEDERRRNPVDCPLCGEPLSCGGPDGTILFCRFDGWRRT
jgi:hypothetical protein